MENTAINDNGHVRIVHGFLILHRVIHNHLASVLLSFVVENSLFAGRFVCGLLTVVVVEVIFVN